LAIVRRTTTTTTTMTMKCSMVGVDSGGMEVGDANAVKRAQSLP